jgi:hypothetical protein
MGILGVLAMPFGFDAIFWKLMGYGITWMDTVALWVTSLPGAVGRVRAFGTGPLLLATAAILLVCLLRTPLRWSGAVLAVIGRPVGGRNAAARRSGFRGRPRRGHPGARWPARGAAQQPRQLRHQGVACRRRRCAHCQERDFAGWRCVRCRRLHRPAQRPPAGVGGFVGRSLRRGLRARRRGGQPARGAERLRRHFDRPQGLARQWRIGAALDRRSLRTKGRPPIGL